MTILERVKLGNWQIEKFTTLFIIIFVALFKLGDFYNQYLATTYLKSLSTVFKKNFFQYGVNKDSLYIKDSSEDYSSYATGRINIAQVNITLRLKPRQNLFIWIMETLLSFFTESVHYPTDKATITITPSSDAEYDNFICAIVSKFGMNEMRRLNYFLSLTRTTDSPKLPQSFVFMSEANELLENILTDELKGSLTVKAASYLNYIAFTDQPIEKPEKILDCVPKRRIVISSNVVSNKAQLEQLSRTLGAIFETVDKLASKKIIFKNETLKKVVKTRETEISKIRKIIEEAKQEELLAQKAELKRNERNKTRGLSQEEQMKLEKKALEKKQRKAMRKQKVRM